MAKAEKTELKPVPKVQVLTRQRIGLMQHLAQVHLAHIPMEHTIEDIVQPSYWSGVSGQLRDNDTIKCVSDDGSWVAELHVRSAAMTAASVVLMNFQECAAIIRESTIDNYKIKWNGPQDKWVILDEATTPSTVVVKGIETKEHAFKELSEYQRKFVA